MLAEPLDPVSAKRLIRQIIETGEVTFSRHAEEELLKDRLTMADAEHVLRAGVGEPAEWINGQWRYRIRTQTLYVVVRFRSETALRVVTAWRIGR
jgi:hypothetical protein